MTSLVVLISIWWHLEVYCAILLPGKWMVLDIPGADPGFDQGGGPRS